MSQQTPYGPPSGPVQSLDAPHGQVAPGYPPAGPRKTNTMAILGLVFAFVFSPLGIVFSAIGLSQIKKRQEGGRGLALTGLILSIVFLLLSLFLFFFVFAVVTEAAQTAAAEQTEAAETEGAVAPANDTGVLGACQVIAPALGGFDAGVETVTTPEEYAVLVTDVRTTIEGAAASTTDPAFVQDVQTMSNNLQLTADAISNGEDPSYLDAALTEDDTRVGEHCAAAGF